MKSVALIFWLAVLSVAGVTYAGWHLWRALSDEPWQSSSIPSQAPAFKTGLFATPGGVLPDFTLTDSTGQEFHLHDTQGHVRAVSFFFVSCPAICFQLNNTLARVQSELKNDDVRFVSITCDPEHDTPAQLATYAARFAADPARWAFLTGPMSTLEAIGRGMQITVMPSTHSDRVVLLDRQGRVRGNFRVTEGDQLVQFKEALAKLSAEPYDPAAAAAIPTASIESQTEPAQPMISLPGAVKN